MIANSFTISNRIRTLFGVAIFISLVVSFLCISFAHVMPVHGNMFERSIHTSHLASVNNCCDVGMSDHMELWKSTLVGIPQGFKDFLALIILAVATRLVFSDFFTTPRHNTKVFFHRYRQYARAHPEIQTYNPLRHAFARGILHPKTY